MTAGTGPRAGALIQERVREEKTLPTGSTASATPDLSGIARAAAAEVPGTSAALLDGFLAVLVAASTTGRRPNRAELDACRDAGEEAAATDLTLAQLVDAHLSAARLLWAQLPGVRQAATVQQRVNVGESVLRATDDALAGVAAGFAAARRRSIRHDEAQRREFIDDLLGGRGEVGRLAERSERSGLSPTATFVVAVVRTPLPLEEHSASTHAAERAVSASWRAGPCLVTTRHRELVCILSGAPGGDAPAAARAAARALGVATGWRAAVSRSTTGVAGVTAAYEEARLALATATELDFPEPVALAEHMLVYRVLLRDRDAIADLITTVLGPLQRARGGPRPWLETLTAYYSSGLNAMETARRLHVSVRTVTYRLSRIEQLTGYRPADPQHRLTVEAAVVGATLLHWPPSTAG